MTHLDIPKLVQERFFLIHLLLLLLRIALAFLQLHIRIVRLILIVLLDADRDIGRRAMWPVEMRDTQIGRK